MLVSICFPWSHSMRSLHCHEPNELILFQRMTSYNIKSHCKRTTLLSSVFSVTKHELTWVNYVGKRQYLFIWNMLWNVKGSFWRDSLHQRFSPKGLSETSFLERIFNGWNSLPLLNEDNKKKCRFTTWKRRGALYQICRLSDHLFEATYWEVNWIVYLSANTEHKLFQPSLHNTTYGFSIYRFESGWS